ncbi:hypothetical protein WN51_09887 [Melipona quadrifasciata]|uniref:Uncharacterized protein n=1 Tax=Melipona quadrifasciata TaxID=166423 RepID=A0A0N0BBE4_9HYME|nr:hypothetical protein WN51_09887 [Melipona quadrifasciata]
MDRYDYLQFHEDNDDTSRGKFRHPEDFDNVVRGARADATLRDTLSEYKARISHTVGHRIYFGGWFTGQAGNNLRMGNVSTNIAKVLAYEFLPCSS